MGRTLELGGGGDAFLLGKNNSLRSDIFFPGRKASPPPPSNLSVCGPGDFEGKYERQGVGRPFQKCAEPWMAEPKRPTDGLEASFGKAYPHAGSELDKEQTRFSKDEVEQVLQG